MNMDKIHIDLCKYLQLVYKMMAVYFNSQLKDASFINLLYFIWSTKGFG